LVRHRRKCARACGAAVVQPPERRDQAETLCTFAMAWYWAQRATDMMATITAADLCTDARNRTQMGKSTRSRGFGGFGDVMGQRVQSLWGTSRCEAMQRQTGEEGKG
jgi:hypothetical protein